jgi:hypothetical protein
MNSLGNHSTRSVQWSVYKQLELIPDAVSRPANRTRYLTSVPSLLWRGLINLLIDELIKEQRAEYLDRCWSLNEFGEGDRSPAHPLQRLWVLMN